MNHPSTQITMHLSIFVGLVALGFWLRFDAPIWSNIFPL